MCSVKWRDAFSRVEGGMFSEVEGACLLNWR